MNRIEFETIDDLALAIDDCVEETFASEDNNGVAIIANYDEAKEIIGSLIFYGYDLTDIDLKLPESNEYYDSYIISLNGDYEIWCEPTKRDGRYINITASEIFLLDTTSSSIIPYLKGNIYEVGLLDYEDVEDEDFDSLDKECSCENCTCKSNSEDLLQGILNKYPIEKCSCESSKVDKPKITINVSSNIDDDEIDEIVDEVVNDVFKNIDTILKFNRDVDFFNKLFW